MEGPGAGGRPAVTLMELQGKRVVVIGLGASNVPLVKYLLKKGARVVAADQKPAAELGEAGRALAGLPITMHLGRDYLARALREEAEMVFLTPGMRKDLPELKAARERDVQFWSEMRLFFHLCRAPILAVTGTSGKTTTTTLLGEMIRAAGFQTYVGGNIGSPLIEQVEEIPPEARVVLELSSFQLQTLDRSPWIGALLNISPNHLDIHASLEEYKAAKENILRFQGRDDWAVLNYRWPGEFEPPGQVCYFSGSTPLPEGAWLEGDRLYFARPGQAPQEICRRDEIQLPGQHNVENVLAAAACALLAGAGMAAVQAVATTFTGVEHRLELVAEVGGVRFINDSIATTPDRTAAALDAFTHEVTLIAGGYDKLIPFDQLGELIARRVPRLVTLGATAEKIEAAVAAAVRAQKGAGPAVYRAGDFEQAVRQAAAVTPPGGVVLLSPACASYDMFPNFAARGQRFREIVQELSQEENAG